MARPARSQPTDGELEILKTLWEQGPSELKQVCGALRRAPAGGHDHSGHDAQDDARQRARRSERDVEEFGLVGAGSAERRRARAWSAG